MTHPPIPGLSKPGLNLYGPEVTKQGILNLDIEVNEFLVLKA